MAHVSHNSGNNEWYTPENIIKAVQNVMGEIDLDPASCEFANKTVKAKQFYSKENSGLEVSWEGNVFMNPPYSRDLLPAFVDKFVEHFMSGQIKEGIVLVNNATETKWFQKLMGVCQQVCFVTGRIKFVSEKGIKCTPLQGQAILYFKQKSVEKKETFETHFKEVGIILNKN